MVLAGLDWGGLGCGEAGRGGGEWGGRRGWHGLGMGLPYAAWTGLDTTEWGRGGRGGDELGDDNMGGVGWNGVGWGGIG